MTLLPTPTSSDSFGSRNATAYRSPDAGPHNSGTTLTDVAWQLEGYVDHRLLPTPRASDCTKGGPNQRCSSSDLMLPSAVTQDWAEYEPAIRRHEAVFGRSAPLPTEPGAKGQPRLSPAFVEWLMGLPAGHVTNPAISISRNDQLKALGNGVVPRQAAAATRAFLADMAKAVVA